MRLLTKEWLASVKRRALRRRVWYTVLTKLERGTVDLTVRCVDEVRSSRLALVVGRVVCKLLKAFRSAFLVRVEVLGSDRAKRVSAIAVEWGYAAAAAWRRDPGFIRFLGVTAYHNPVGWE